MSEEGLTHPGSWVGDSLEEFKKLPTWGKIAAGGALVAVVGIAIYEKNKAGKSGVGTALSSSGASGAATTDPNALLGGTQSPFGQIPSGNGNSVPLIPWGDTPIFDKLGNLIGWQQPGPTPTPTPNPPPKGPPGPPTPKPKPGPKPKDDKDKHDHDKKFIAHPIHQVPRPEVHKGPQHSTPPPRPKVVVRSNVR